MTELSIPELSIPELSLVVLVGVTGSGKSAFARAHFKPTEVISSDFCRGLVADDENDQSATRDAFEVLRFIAGKRLAAGRLTVVDATNVQPEARRELVLLAREHDVLPVAIVLDLPERLCAERNAQRPDRDFGPHVIRRQRSQLRRGRSHLGREGFRTVHVLRTPEEAAAATVTRTKLFNDLRHEKGPFDVIGDVHGCRAELEQLLDRLGYAIDRDGAGRPVNASHPTRRAVFLGDLVDRGPDTPGVLRLVMGMVAAGTALCVPGNHEAKLLKALRGKNVTRSHGLDASMEQLEAEPAEFLAAVETFIDSLVSHYVLDGGRLVAAHAGLIERYQGRASGRVREFCLYGQTTGETDEYGLPVRYPWAQEYRGRALVLYGHTPVPEAEWLNNTLCLDTGCVFGGRLTALNYPERTLVSVPAARVYHPPAKPFPASSPSGVGPARREPDVLDIGDVSGSRVIETGYLPRVGLREAHAAAALEVMSRFALDPRWLLYLPPTMSPVATSPRRWRRICSSTPSRRSRPTARTAWRTCCARRSTWARARCCWSAAPRRLPGPGSACRPAMPAARSGPGPAGRSSPPPSTRTWPAGCARRPRPPGCSTNSAPPGCCWTPNYCPGTSRPAQLLRDQYAAVGAAARAALPAAVAALEQARARELPADGPAVDALLDRTRARMTNAGAFTDAYLRYCWATDGLAGVRVAPFQVLATEGAVYHERPHHWHLDPADRLAAAAPDLITTTRRLAARTTDPASAAAATRWWEDADRRRGRGHGGQARRQPDPRPPRQRLKPAGRSRPARPQGPRPGVPAPHLRPRLHRAGQPGPAAPACARPQALARPARVRPRPGGAGPGGPRRAAVAGARMRLRRAGPGVRAGRPPALTPLLARLAGWPHDRLRP